MNYVDLTEDKDDHHIRPPDNIVRERLIPTQNQNIYASESDIAAVMEASRREYDDEIERQFLEMHEAAKQSREKRFINIKKTIERVMCFDKASVNEYAMLLNSFKLYEEGYVEHFEVNDELVYNRIISLLKTLRITPEEHADLKNYMRK
jgi:hypothetical protein